ncbi:MAG: hypothetical protein AAGI17_01930 [Planctomycetota bacterium]
MDPNLRIAKAMASTLNAAPGSTFSHSFNAAGGYFKARKAAVGTGIVVDIAPVSNTRNEDVDSRGLEARTRSFSVVVREQHTDDPTEEAVGRAPELANELMAYLRENAIGLDVSWLGDDQDLVLDPAELQSSNQSRSTFSIEYVTGREVT